MGMKASLGRRIKDASLVIGIDVAKQRHVAVAEEHDGRTSKPFVFENSLAGFHSFQTWAHQTTARVGLNAVVIALEPTGHYGRSLEDWLVERGFELRHVSGVATCRAKDLMDGSPLKSDAKDAAVIADLARQGKSRPLSSLSTPFAELRFLAEARRRLVVERGALLNRLHRLLDLLFPELPRLFSRLDGPTIQALLQVAPTPAEVLALGEAKVCELLQAKSRGRLGSARASALIEAASNSVGIQRGAEALRLDLSLVLPRIETLTSQREQVEARMQQVLEAIDYAPSLLAIPGLGLVTVGVMLGELGDLRGYRHSRQVLKMAGLSLFEVSSGKQRGERHITKRGRAQLRQICYMAVLRMSGAGGLLHDHYQRMKATKPACKAIVAGMRRLLVMVFAMVRDGQPFSQARFDAQPTRVCQTLAA